MSAAVGDVVRIERDEELHPSKGTWRQFRGKTATVVEISRGEYGVVFGKPRLGGVGGQNEPSTWFLSHEMTLRSRDRG